MLRLSFQMEACLPGTIPDPPLLAAALDLVSEHSKLFYFQKILLYEMNLFKWGYSKSMLLKIKIRVMVNAVKHLLYITEGNDRKKKNL